MDKRDKGRRKEIMGYALAVLVAMSLFIIVGRSAEGADNWCECEDGMRSLDHCGSCHYAHCTGLTSCECKTKEADYYEDVCYNCVSDATSGDDGIYFFLSSTDYNRGDANKDGNCCGDDSGEYYIDSSNNNGGKACCNAASDCGTSDHYCWSSGTVHSNSYLCYSSDIYVCDSSHYCAFIGGDWACLGDGSGGFSWRSNVGCNTDRCICAKSGCAGEEGHFINADEYYRHDGTTFCCMGQVYWVGELKIGGLGSNDCGTLDGNYPSCVTEQMN